MGKQIGAILSFVVGILLLLKFAFWSLGYILSPSPEGIQHGTELIGEAAIPWWIGVMDWLAVLPLAGLLILGFILFLKWTGQV